MNRRDHLRALLESHTPSDAQEAQHLERMLQLCAIPGDPFSRNHFVPGHFTASAFILSPDHSSTLLILHGKLHRWLQPGGHVDPDDLDIIAAARREVAEEVGLTHLPLAPGAPILDVDIHAIPPLKGDPGHLHFDVRVCFVATTLEAAAGSDAKDARWVPLAEVGQWETDESVLRVVRKLRETTRA